MTPRRLLLVLVCSLLFFAAPVRAEDEEKADSPSKSKADPRLQGLKWRCIGPARGGRVSSVSGVVGERETYYMGSCGGGLWKTTDAGTSWRNISDKFFKTGSVGAVAVSQSDTNVIYVGMGEPDPRGNFSHGDGIYRSVDGGKTFHQRGLSETRHIGRIVIDPKNPQLVFVAALGHVYGPNSERGIYRSEDGGATWKRVHFVDDDTGAVDISMDPNNSSVLYAGFWQVRRKPWRFDSGGKGSGLWRSRDGGDSWQKLEKGLPKGIQGKIGVSASAARKDLVYAIVEAKDGGVFRSTDGGDSWKKVNTERKLRQRAWYYSRIHADPQEADTVYVLNVQFHKSVDGGESFQSIRTPHVDNHGLWIDPDDNQRMIEGNDGGANVSTDGGRRWSRQDTQTTAQFYRVAVDNRFPYRVLGAQQDNSTVSIPHTSHARNSRDFYPIGGGESGYIAVRPDNPDVIYAGSYAGWLTRHDHEKGTSRAISPWPENPIGGGAGVLRHRFQWTFPIVLSPHDPNVLYVGGESLFRTDDGGQSWKAISGDLTTNDKEKQKSSGGPITQDNTTVEYHCTIFSVAESPKQKGRIWIGTDDGKVQVTDNGGGKWEDVTPKGLQSDALVSIVEASPHDADTAWLAVTRYKSDDFHPYLYRTRDRGKSWDLISTGIPGDAFVRSVREDPVRKDLLYAGTETGIWYSLDAGDSWQSLQLNLPVVPVTDLVTKDDDLVISTQGRSFWILAGLSRLRKWGRGSPVGVSLMPPVAANRGLRRSARIHFHVPADAPKPLTLSFKDEQGKLVRTFDVVLEDPKEEKAAKSADENKGDEKKADEMDPGEGEADESVEKNATTEEGDASPKKKAGRKGKRGRGKKNSKRATIKAQPGMNLFVWDMRREKPATVPGAVGWPTVRSGPRVLPGDYTVVLTAGMQADANGIKFEIHPQPLRINVDPRQGLSAEERTIAATHATAVYDTLDRVHKAVNRIREVRKQVTAARAWAKRAGMARKLKKSADALLKALQAVEDALIQTKSKSSQDPLNFPVRLNDKLATLLQQADRDPRPTQGQRDVLASLQKRVGVQLDKLEKALRELIPAFNDAVWAAKIPAVAPAEDEALAPVK